MKTTTMKQGLLALAGLAALFATSACHKTAPVAQRPPDATPVAQAPPQQTPTVQNLPPAAKPAPASKPVAQTPQAPKALTPQERARLNEILARLEDALFDYDKSTIRTDASSALRDDVGVIRDILANYPAQKLLIEGHCDERGSDEYNLALGDRRSRAAEDFLTQLGIPNSQLTIISYGKQRPVCTDASEACWQSNRRAHVTAAP
jgi:peptidoglycan-associated lipoprotein